MAFQAFRSAREATLFRVLRRSADQSSHQLYRAFLAQLRAGGLPELLAAYPVLGRYWGLMVEAWTETLTELLVRLDDDAPLLRSCLGIELAGEPLERLRMGLSDRHHGGRTVMQLDFPGGQRVIYKPKGLGLEAAYNRLVAWLAEQGAPVRLRAIQVVDRAAYGWAQFVEPAGCASRLDVAGYYRRAGALLCLVHLLEGTDCHLENIVAAGVDPVLVDAETLLHHRVGRAPSSRDDDPDLLASEEYWASVYRTGMLPSWVLDREGKPVDISGLGGFGEQATLRRLLRWDYVNSDEMQLRAGPGHLTREANVPTLDGVAQSPLAHEAELVSGFSAMHEFWQRHRGALTSAEGPVARLGRQASRIIARDSADYGELLHRLIQPAALVSGVAQSIVLEPLAAVIVANPDRAARSEHWRLVRAEQEALLRYDIPYFSALADSTDLDLPGGERISGFFSRSGFEQSLAKINAIGPDDLRRQVRFIRAAFFSRSAETAHPRPRRKAQDGRAGAPRPALTDQQLIGAAQRIAERLWDEAIRVAGGAAWIGLDYRQQTRRYQYQPVGNGFYSGRCGIGLFLAALWSVTGEERWRELALGAVAGARRGLRAHGARRTWSVADASAAYALGRMGTFFGDQDLRRDALAVAARIDAATIAADETFDVLFGSAGAALSFLTLHRLYGEEGLLDKAVAAGDRLLAGRTPTATGHRAWKSGGLAALTGFSHGAAGVAYALLALADATGSDPFREAALEGLAFERAAFDPAAGNWPDFRSAGGRPAAGRFMAAWCNGATGIGLSRLGARALIGDGAVGTEIDLALEATRRCGTQDADQLCCGNFGRVELLLAAGCQLGRPALVAEARQWAAERVRLAERHQGYRTIRGLPRWVHNPGFFQGISGIGYGLLRLARPDDLPIVLLWA